MVYLFVVNLLYQRFGAIFMSMHRFAKLFCLSNQAFTPILLMGKLSYKKYILENFRYREYAENFSKKIKAAVKALNPFAEAYEKTGLLIEGLEVYYKPYSTYLIFFVIEDKTVTVIRVLKDRMYWQSIINRMKKIER